MLMPIAVLGCLLAALPAGPGPDDPPRKLDDWPATRPPAPNTEPHFAANHDSRRNRVVGLDAGQAVATTLEDVAVPAPLPPAIERAVGPRSTKGRRFAAEVEDGWIVAENRGEFGASVRWIARDGQDQYPISDRNVAGFVATRSGLLMLEGLAHLGRDRGGLHRLIQRPNRRWTAEPFADLGSAPAVATRDGDDALLVVSHRRLSRVDLTTKRVEILVDDAFWQSLDPNSILVDPARRVFIGMRHGVARLDQVGPNPTIDWLLPSRAAAEPKSAP